jgi:hypothetical protein
MLGIMLEVAMIVAIVALVLAHIRLRDRIEVLEGTLDRLERESGSTAQTAK